MLHAAGTQVLDNRQLPDFPESLPSDVLPVAFPAGLVHRAVLTAELLSINR